MSDYALLIRPTGLIHNHTLINHFDMRIIVWNFCHDKILILEKGYQVLCILIHRVYINNLLQLHTRTRERNSVQLKLIAFIVRCTRC